MFRFTVYRKLILARVINIFQLFMVFIIFNAGYRSVIFIVPFIVLIINFISELNIYFYLKEHPEYRDKTIKELEIE